MELFRWKGAIQNNAGNLPVDKNISQEKLSSKGRRAKDLIKSVIDSMPKILLTPGGSGEGMYLVCDINKDISGDPADQFTGGSAESVDHRYCY